MGVLLERLVRVGESMIRGFGDEIVSRPEVLVEAAMGEAGRLHDLGDSGATEAFLTDPLTFAGGCQCPTDWVQLGCHEPAR